MPTDNISLESLTDLVAKINTMLSNHQAIIFAKMLERKGFTHPTPHEINELGLSPSKTDLLKGYLKKINDNELFALAVSIFQNVKSESSNPIEICWTGPSKNRYVRMTWPALSEMLLSAKKSILIVGYAINTNMGSIMDYLEEKSRSGVNLIFMIDRLEEKEAFLLWAKRLPQPPELYDRPKNIDDPMSALHIKCIVVDERVAMFGSANLTYHGMRGNIELGLVLSDETAVKSIVDLLDGLKEDLVRFDISG
jgi:hypothetical protein